MNTKFKDFDSFCYNIKFFPPVTLEGNDYLRVIYNVIKKLPISISEKVIDEVTFIGMDNDNPGQFWVHTHISKKEELEVPSIYLNFAQIKDDKEKESIIAHEIAHFVLWHTSSSPDIEKAADDLCEEWGFGRAYPE